MGATEIPYSKVKAGQFQRIFVDTNVVFDIHEHVLASTLNAAAIAAIAAQNAGRTPQKKPELIHLLNSARQGQTVLIVTPLVLEEIAHKYLRRFLAKLEQNYSRKGKELRLYVPIEHETARKAAMVFFQDALNALQKYSITIHMPTIANADTKTYGKNHNYLLIHLLNKYPDLGAMDAVHVIWSQVLGCDAFLSRDSDVRSVDGLVVLVPG